MEGGGGPLKTRTSVVVTTLAATGDPPRLRPSPAGNGRRRWRVPGSHSGTTGHGPSERDDTGRTGRGRTHPRHGREGGMVGRKGF